MRQSAEEYGVGGNKDFFNFEKSGEYALRLLSKPVAMATHFFGPGVPGSVCYGKANGCPYHKADDKQPSLKFQCYVVDRIDGKVKLAELPWSVVSAVSDLEVDEEWAYTGYPMPYDIRVKVDKENKDPKSIYKTLGSIRRDVITTEEENDFIKQDEKLSVDKYIQSRKDKQIAAHKEKGIWITEEERVRAEQDRLAEGAAIQAAAPEEPAVEYPEGPNPEDIPF